jgi:hypothetical protein
MPIKMRDLLDHLERERAVEEKSLYRQFGKRLVLDAIHRGAVARVDRINGKTMIVRKSA